MSGGPPMLLKLLRKRLSLQGIGRPPFEEDLVGWWKFDEGKGDIAYDSSPVGQHLVMQNPGHIYRPVWVPEGLEFYSGRSGAGSYMRSADYYHPAPASQPVGFFVLQKCTYTGNQSQYLIFNQTTSFANTFRGLPTGTATPYNSTFYAAGGSDASPDKPYASPDYNVVGFSHNASTSARFFTNNFRSRFSTWAEGNLWGDRYRYTIFGGNGGTDAFSGTVVCVLWYRKAFNGAVDIEPVFAYMKRVAKSRGIVIGTRWELAKTLWDYASWKWGD